MCGALFAFSSTQANDDFHAYYENTKIERYIRRYNMRRHAVERYASLIYVRSNSSKVLECIV